MTWQSFVCCIDELQQLLAVAFEVKLPSHELQYPSVKCGGPLAKRIGFEVWNDAAILGGHGRLYSSANVGVNVFYANAV